MKRILFSMALLLSINTLSAKIVYRFIVGTYTNQTLSKGIYTIEFNVDKKTVNTQLSADNVFDPSYLALTADGKYLYSISERGVNSSISAYSFNKTNGKMSFINRVNGKGADPCYVAVSDQHVITANYSGGNVSVFGRNADGSLTEAIQSVQHFGKSINAQRQTKPYVHQTIFSPDHHFVLVNDLGTDYITSYRYNNTSNEKVLTVTDSLKVKAGSGPRHSVFSKSGKFMYVIHELDGTISVVGFSDGKLTLLDETTVVRKENLQTGAADIHISPDGKFLYATNRGTANDISCFKILNNGKLEYVQQISVSGIGPRNFAVTKDGLFVLVANQKSNQIVLFKRNKATGVLTETNLKINLQAPVCLVEY